MTTPLTKIYEQAIYDYANYLGIDKNKPLDEIKIILAELFNNPKVDGEYYRNEFIGALNAKLYSNDSLNMKAIRGDPSELGVKIVDKTSGGSLKRKNRRTKRRHSKPRATRKHRNKSNRKK
jgi:hypothetical protein